MKQMKLLTVDSGTAALALKDLSRSRGCLDHGGHGGKGGDGQLHAVS